MCTPEEFFPGCQALPSHGIAQRGILDISRYVNAEPSVIVEMHLDGIHVGVSIFSHFRAGEQENFCG